MHYCYLRSFQAAQRELERQRKEELEKRRRSELQKKKEQEQNEIVKLRAKKRSLEMELEAVVSVVSKFSDPQNKFPSYSSNASVLQGNKHRQISDRLRDIRNKKKLQKTELDLTNQRKETCQQDISSLQKQIEVCIFESLFLCYSSPPVLLCADRILINQ